ncbi:hypothetical protein Tco_0359527 [Tanacetum coccineum]
MADKETKSTIRELAANDQADYYSRITSIKVNGKNAYELKGKFLDNLHKNAFSGTNEEDAVEHIKYFLKIINPIDLPNVNQDKLRVVVFPISLAGALWDYWKLGRDKIEATNEETFDLRSLVVHYCKTFNYKSGYSEWPTYSWKEDGYCNGENLPVGYIVGNTLHCQDLEWYDALKDNELKDEALRNKAIMEGLIDEDDKSSNNGWKRWDGYEIADHDQEERKYENKHENKERCELSDDHELPICNIIRFEMVKYFVSRETEDLSHDGRRMDGNQRRVERKLKKKSNLKTSL